MVGQQGMGGGAGSSNLGLRVALCALLPVLTLVTARKGAAQQASTSGPAASADVTPQALTGKERWNLYVNETFRSSGPYVVSLGAGLVYQAFDYPPEWGGGFRGFGRRSANQFGILTIQNTLHDGGEALLGYEPRYVPCRCRGAWRRTGHALEMSFLTYDQNGHKRFDLPQLAGAYGSGVLSTLWYPRRYTPQVQGIQTGHMQFGFVMGTNLFAEFRPEFQRAWPFRKFLNRSSGKTP
jgi:hypothetical protein